MKPNNGTRSTSTAVLAIVVAVAVALSAGAAVGIPADAGDSQAVTGQNSQFAQVTDNETNVSDDNQTELTRTSEHITYTAPAGESFEVGELSVEEDGETTVEAEISNPNDWLAIQHIEVRVDGVVVERNPVALDAEESENHTFEVDSENATDGAVISVLSYDHGAVHTIGEEAEEDEDLNVSSPFADEEDNETEEDENVTAPLDEEDNVTEEEDNETSPFAEEEDNETEDNVTAPLDEEGNETTTEEDNATTTEEDENVTAPLDEEGNETTTEEENATAEQTSVTFSDQESDGTTVTVDEATLEEGGFVVIHNEAGDAIGSSEYLSAGTSEDVEVTLDETLEEDATLTAMAHQDTNDNEEMDFLTSDGEDDGPYTMNDSPITDDAEVSVSA